MAIEKSKILERLHCVFPDGVIYKDEYSAKRATISIPVDMAIWKAAKVQGITREQWLQESGFIWKSVGYIEPDMRYGSNTISSHTDAFAIADYVFKAYPLAGEYLLSNAEEACLFQSAQNTVQKIILDHDQITTNEEAILTLETIELLKQWSSDLSDDEISGSFWSYVFLQYGFNPENSDRAAQRLYTRFCAAIRGTLIRYHRFFAPEGTKRYYTSLLLHAISPTQSIENLYTILFDFYVKNLDFQYVPEDVSYQVFTRSICSRWNKNNQSEKNIQLRSDTVFSGLKTLFSERRGYMASVCDDIVRKMDLLLRGQFEDSQNYWEKLLVDWYEKKSHTERVRMQGEQRERKTEFVATSEDRIYMQYILANEQVSIEIPRIRLPDVGEERPIITLFQEDREIYSAIMSVTGNDLCLTTKKKIIQLADTDIDFDAPLAVRGQISYMGNDIYNSSRKLYRQNLIFDAHGNERTVKSGSVFLLVENTVSVEFTGDAGVFQLPHPGQLFKINLDEVTSVAIDGIELFADDKMAAQFRSHASRNPVDGLFAISENNSYHVFSAPFSLFLLLPDNEQLLRYQIAIDANRHAPSEFQQTDRKDLCIPANISDGKPHSIRIIDLVGDAVKFEYRYIILPNCSYRLGQKIYSEATPEIALSLTSGDHCFDVSAVHGDENDYVKFPCPYSDFEFELAIPTVHCSLMGQSAFCAPEKIWHKELSGGEFVKLSVPSEWVGGVFLGVKQVPVSATREYEFELGNLLRSGVAFSAEEPLWLSLKSETGDTIKKLLTTIVFRPQFLKPPLEILEGQLKWLAASNYIGDADSEFTVEVSLCHEGQRNYSVACEDLVLGDAADFPHGLYHYRILSRKKSVFFSDASEELYAGDFISGNRNELLFDGKELLLGAPYYWDGPADAMKTMQMRSGAGVLEHLRYIGNTIASGETIALPEYEATLYFEDSYGRRIPFNSREDSKKYEYINPAHVWIVNERMLILRAVTNDAVYIDTQYATILSRSPDTAMSRDAQRVRLQTPDYFEYTPKEV